jgi:hypothetical protein
MSRFVQVLAVCVGWVVCQPAIGAVTLTFDSLTQAGNGIALQSDTYIESGYRLTVTPNTGNNNPPGFAVWQTGSTNFPGSTSLFSDFSDHTITLARVDNTAFAFTSIDISLVQRPPVGPPVVASVQFTGVLDGGGLVTSPTFETNGSFGLQSFAPSLNNVTSVSWVQALPAHQFDNIVLNDVSAVPEPSSLLLVGLLSASCVGYRRRQA